MPKPACVKCQRFYRPKQNGYRVMEMMPIGSALPGDLMPERWQPYKIWTCDLWRCDGCGHELAAGYGREPLAEHYQYHFKDFAMTVQSVINDC